MSPGGKAVSAVTNRSRSRRKAAWMTLFMLISLMRGSLEVLSDDGHRPSTCSGPIGEGRGDGTHHSGGAREDSSMRKTPAARSRSGSTGRRTANYDVGMAKV